LVAPSAWAQSDDELFAQVFGNRAQASAAVDLDIDVMVQSVTIGSTRALIDGERIVDLDRESLLELFDSFIAENRLEALRGEESRITPEQLAEVGIDLVYNAEALALEVNVPPEYRIEWQVPIAPRRSPSPGRTRYDSAHVSAALNVAPSLLHDSGTGRWDGAISADGFVNVAGWAAQGEASWSERSGRLRRGPVRLHRDLVKRRLRLTVGELRSPAFGLQPALPLRGVSIGRVFSIDPYDPPFPGLVAPLLLEAPTEVEVAVDGRVVERVRLPAGPTLLSDFPFRAGLNDVRVDLYRDGVLQRQLDYQGWFDRIRLGAGRQEFHVSLGQPWLLDGDRPSVQQDEPWISAAVRRGLSARWTTGLGLLFDTDTSDAVLNWSNDIGFRHWSLSSDLAISRDDRPGTAGTFSLQQEPVRGRIWSLRMALGWRDRRFRPFGIAEAPGRELRGELSASRPIGQRLRWSGSARVTDGQGGRRSRFSSVLAWRPSLEWSLQLRAAAKRGAGPDDFGLTITLDWRPRRGDHAFSAEFDDDGDWLSAWRWNDQLARRGRSASLVVQEVDGERVVSGAASQRNHRIRAGIDHQRSVGDSSRTRLAAQTALVFADGHFGVSDRVGDGFVLFAARPGTGRVEVNPDDDYRSRSGAFGPAVIGDLTPYLERGFTVGLPDVPIRSDPGDLQPVARGGFLQGVVLPVGPVPGVAVRFTLVGSDGEPIELAVGKLVPEHGGEGRTWFSNRDGRVELGSIPPGRYRLKVAAAGIDRPIEIPPAPATQDLGELSP
jgi:outer membrane usher protein